MEKKRAHVALFSSQGFTPTGIQLQLRRSVVTVNLDFCRYWSRKDRVDSFLEGRGLLDGKKTVGAKGFLMTRKWEKCTS